MVNLSGKVAFVTGGSQGIGKQVCHELLKRNVKVAFADIAVEKGEETLKELQTKYGDQNIIFINLDVTNEPEFEGAIILAKSAFERLDYLINNAGVAGEENWRRTIDVNLNGVIIGTLLGIEHLSDDKGTKAGTMIINTASIAGIQLVITHPAYAASKHGCVAWSKCMGNEKNVAITGVKVNAVCPDSTDTALVASFCDTAFNKEEAIKLKDSMEKDKAIMTTETVASGFIKLLEEDVTGKLLVASYEKGLYYLPYES